MITLSLVRTLAPALGLFLGTSTLSAVASPTAPQQPGQAKAFCQTPEMYTLTNGLRRGAKPKRFEITGVAYTLTCASVAWINSGQQAYLEDDIVVTTSQRRTSLFCNQALYDRATGTIRLQGMVRVTETPAGALRSVVRTGDSGLLTLGSPSTVPQIVLHSDPPEAQYHPKRRA